MPSDAKFGLIIGLGLVVFLAAMFFRRDDAEVKLPTNAVKNGNKTQTPAKKNPSSTPVKAIPAKFAPTSDHSPRTHIVQDGDTLYSLAKQYYQDESRFVELYQANRQTLSSPSSLIPGTVLLIPTTTASQGTTPTQEATMTGEATTTFANHVDETENRNRRDQRTKTYGEE